MNEPKTQTVADRDDSSFEDETIPFVCREPLLLSYQMTLVELNPYNTILGVYLTNTDG
jgi:hypothetical protein